MTDMARILSHLNEARAGLLAALDSVSAERWRDPPRPGKWSAGEVIAHLRMVETRVTEAAARIIRKDPRPVPPWRRLHFPVRLVGWRAIPARTPVPLDPGLVLEKDVVLPAFADLRRRTLAFLDETRTRNLRAFRWDHPLLGNLHFYYWFRMLAFHEERHTRQILEIVEIFQK